MGSSGDTTKCLDLAQETPRLVRARGAGGSGGGTGAGSNQLERFLYRRAVRMQAECPRDDCRQVKDEYSTLELRYTM